MNEHCSICGCALHRTAGSYAQPNVLGRSHATAHHFVAERFFGRSSNRRGAKTDRIFADCSWGHEDESTVFCYECHEELLHNPVLLPDDVKHFTDLVRERGLTEDEKTDDRSKLGGRVKLFQEVIARGLSALREKN